MEVHCDQYAFNLEKEQISASSFCDDDSYIFSAYMNIYKGMTYCIKTKKGKKMAAVCLWLIENKSIQMFRSVLCHLWRYFHVIKITWVSTSSAYMICGAALIWALKVLQHNLNKKYSKCNNKQAANVEKPTCNIISAACTLIKTTSYDKIPTFSRFIYFLNMLSHPLLCWQQVHTM